MLLIIAILFLAGVVVLTRHYWLRVAEERDLAAETRWLKLWNIKGLGIPLLLWAVFNSGIISNMPALVPTVEVGRAAGKTLSAFADATAGAIWIVSTYWCALTFGWMTVKLYQRIDRRSEFLGIAFMWFLVVLFFAALLLFSLGWAGVGFVLVLWFGATIHNSVSLTPVKVPPSYSRAIAKLNFDKYNEAEWEIIRELEKCEHDFDGWMLLAELYATRFQDLVAAEKTISDLCDDPNTTPSQLALALNRLADWEMKIAGEPAAARRVLEMISRRLPDTHLDRMARQRINNLPATREAWLRERESKTVRIPTAESGEPAPPIGEEFARTMAKNYVDQLNRNPDNAEAREQFARLLAESLHEPGMAVEQLGLLLSMSNQPPDKRAEWLLLMADWQAKHLQDFGAAELALKRVIRELPDSRLAFEAQRRIYLLGIERQTHTRQQPVATAAPNAA